MTHIRFVSPGAVSNAHTCLHRQQQPVSICSCHGCLRIFGITYNYRYYGEYALFCLVFQGPCSQGLELLRCCGWSLPLHWCPPCCSMVCDVSITTNSWNRWTKRLHLMMLFHYYWIMGEMLGDVCNLFLSLSPTHTQTVCVQVNTLISRLYKSLIGLSWPVL